MVLWLQEFILTQLCKQDVVQHNKLSLCFRRKKEKVTAVNKARSFSHNFPFRPNVLTWKMSRYHLWSSTLNAGNEPACWNSLKNNKKITACVRGNRVTEGWRETSQEALLALGNQVSWISSVRWCRLFYSFVLSQFKTLWNADV